MIRVESKRKNMEENTAVDAAVDAAVDRYAITFGEVAILHVGGIQLGNEQRNHGFSVSDLKQIQTKLLEENYRCQLTMISDALPEAQRAENEAAILVIRNGAKLFLGEKGADMLLEEQKSINYDTKFFDRGQTKNKRARHNLVFGDKAETHSEDYKQPSVVAFSSLPHLQEVRKGLESRFGPKAKALYAEGNHYFHKASGIGFHGDSERKIVICLSLGSSSVLRYAWRLPGRSDHYGQCVDVPVSHGDVYIMSEKATGYDWRMRSRVRVVHAAGSHAFAKK